MILRVEELLSASDASKQRHDFRISVGGVPYDDSWRKQHEKDFSRWGLLSPSGCRAAVRLDKEVLLVCSQFSTTRSGCLDV